MNDWTEQTAEVAQWRRDSEVLERVLDRIMDMRTNLAVNSQLEGLVEYRECCAETALDCLNTLESVAAGEERE